MTARLERPRTAWLLAATVVCFAGSLVVQYARERYIPPPPQEESMLYVDSASAISRLALGYDAIVADLYWIRAVQYFGRTRLSHDAAKNYDLLYPLLDITTTLDPSFNIAYRFGAIFLSEGYPNGPGKPEDAIALLEKGFAANPTRWQYLYDAAFVNYWWLHDYTAAAAWFRRAANVPGSPEWLGGLAAVTLAQGGDRAGSRLLWQQMYQSAEHEWIRRTAEHRLAQLAVMDELDRINQLLDRVRQETGEPVSSWKPLAARGWLRVNPPKDPSGTPYVIDPATGRATVSNSSPYFPLPTEQPAPGAPPS